MSWITGQTSGPNRPSTASTGTPDAFRRRRRAPTPGAKLMPRQRLSIGVSGSSAPQLGWAVLQALHRHPDIETHLVISRGADKTIQLEMSSDRADFEAIADVSYDPDDLGAAISSGSFRTIGMAVVP